MICPHCHTGINLTVTLTEAWQNDPTGERLDGHGLAYGHCSECAQFIVLFQKGIYRGHHGSGYLNEILSEQIIYPTHYSRPVEAEVPDAYKTDFLEACTVLALSPKASAALSRRLLQHILQEKFVIKKSNLADEIEAFIKLPAVPSYLAEAVDAIRNVGNFAAHPLKDTNTGEIVDVEPGEAEWLLDVLEALFDFAFVQPVRLEKKKQQLNDKLQSLGKPPMKKPKK